MGRTNFQKQIKILYLFLITLLFTVGSAIGQDTAKIVTAVELTRMNVIYRGMDNHVKIVSSGCPTSKLEISIDKGTITGSNGEYIIRPKGNRGEAFLIVKCKGRIIQKRTLRIKRQPNPAIAFQVGKIDYIHKQQEFVCKEFLLKVDRLKIVMEDFYFDEKIEIVGFTLVVIGSDSKELEAVSYNDRFTDEQISLIKNAKVNSRIILEQINLTFNKKVNLRMQPIVFKIK